MLLYAFTYSFLKFCNYSFLFWNPTFAYEEYHFDKGKQSLLATTYDIGNSVGGLLLGFLSDVLKMKSMILLISSGMSVIALLCFNQLTESTYWVSFILMVCGATDGW